MPAFWVLLAAPTGHRLNFRFQKGSLAKDPHGMGPRDEPSQVLQPIAQPFENQKHDWPFCPETLPSVPGTGHQPVAVSTLGHFPAAVHGTGTGVEIYGRPSCRFCEAAKRVLAARGISCVLPHPR